MWNSVVDAPPISAIVRTYTAVDACNNVSQAEQIIQLTDVEAPEWSFFQRMSPSNAQTCMSGSPHGDRQPHASNHLGSGYGWRCIQGVYDVVFDFTAVDDCDNIAEHQHVVHVEDTVSPEWATFPEDYTMACGEELGHHHAHCD